MRRVATIVPGKKDNSTLPTRNIRAIPQSRRGRILAEKQRFRLVERGRKQPLDATLLSFFARETLYLFLERLLNTKG